jgi:hypothetical protein
MEQPDLAVHDIQVNDTTTFGPGGQGVPQRKVTFYVGTHGPFVLTYAAKDATAARIKSDIQAQVAELQSIHELGV